ncbi:hypothetical protein BX616_011329 [Lobosporangium transversale]|uniref:non-specific serine/threonine protein kinase n=1 Tax=Lobosporangium transversale TaxID=64571 RepID=A0A1Y2GUG3_9FUNG|nr:hypothetical protein BCR41DRAFT_420816 [Lobosporangium transversale]KAF9908976.1 hypothetical protein BX616_011329 [Lobosporangium transversale]ORZ21906.1 hypothetical protein BCR41DRAFT_420816 [Lobosporangium transversale]|eukprot:XP_021883157.1 hypothetical protein BCR41DRAFT_420816 [Lobosporangium transversale]
MTGEPPPLTPRTPPAPRTPPSRPLGAYRGSRAGRDDQINAPGAPRTPKIMPAWQDPTSPTPMNMRRVRRSTSNLPPLARAIMGDLSDPQSQSPSHASAANGVGILEEGDVELETRLSSGAENGLHTQPRLLVTIPLSSKKRPHANNSIHSNDTSQKQRRYECAQANNSNRDPIMGSPSVRVSMERNLHFQKPLVEKRPKSVLEDPIGSGTSERPNKTRNPPWNHASASTTNISDALQSKVGWTKLDGTETDAEQRAKIDGVQLERKGGTTYQETELHYSEDARPHSEDDQGDVHDIESDGEEGHGRPAISDFARKEMEEFERGFNGLQGKFKLLNKIGEGTFSSVYKAIDLEYDQYDNSGWDYGLDRHPQRSSGEAEEQKEETKDIPEVAVKSNNAKEGKVVAIKRIYVTSSPRRIENEISILRQLSGHKNVVPLITAFRSMDQVIVVLPYFEHRDFRDYYKTLPMDDIRCYFRALLRGLEHVHSFGIIHRDIKPSNFLYDTEARTGLIVDFGLAHRQEDPPTRENDTSTTPESKAARDSRVSVDNRINTNIQPQVAVARNIMTGTSDVNAEKTNVAHSLATSNVKTEDTAIRTGSGVKNTSVATSNPANQSGNQVSGTELSNVSVSAPSSAFQTLTSINSTKQKIPTSVPMPGPINSQNSILATNREPGVLRKDPRPVVRVNRAGTRGFRAPEVLFRHLHQTIALDIWSVGCILIAFLTGRFPFFNSIDDVEAVLEIAILFGRHEMEKAAATFDRSFVTNVPTVKDEPICLLKICRVLNPTRFNPPPGYVTQFSHRKIAAISAARAARALRAARAQQLSLSGITASQTSLVQQSQQRPMFTSNDPRGLKHQQAPTVSYTKDDRQLTHTAHSQQPSSIVSNGKLNPNDGLKNRTTHSTTITRGTKTGSASTIQPPYNPSMAHPHVANNDASDKNKKADNGSSTSALLQNMKHGDGDDYENEKDDRHVDIDEFAAAAECTATESKSVGKNATEEFRRKARSKKPPVIGTDSQEDLILAVDLLEQMLTLDPRRRITAANALKHPFLAEKKKE